MTSHGFAPLRSPSAGIAEDYRQVCDNADDGPVRRPPYDGFRTDASNR